MQPKPYCFSVFMMGNGVVWYMMMFTFFFLHKNFPQMSNNKKKPKIYRIGFGPGSFGSQQSHHHQQQPTQAVVQSHTHTHSRINTKTFAATDTKKIGHKNICVFISTTYLIFMAFCGIVCAWSGGKVDCWDSDCSGDMAGQREEENYVSLCRNKIKSHMFFIWNGDDRKRDGGR